MMKLLCFGGQVNPVTKKMVLLASMYLCQAIPLGYVFGCLPVILREGRMSLEGIGGLFALHLPWAFKFVYASWVDRTYFPALGRRRSWIFPMQWIGAALLLVASQTPPETEFGAMYAVLMALNIVMATNDIAVDGYATDLLEPHERGWGNTIQAGARYVGMILGGGLMLFLHSSLGWDVLCITLSAIVFLLSLPVFLHREVASAFKEDVRREQGNEGVLAFLRQREILWLLPVLIAPTAFIFCGFQMRTPLLVDLGLDAKAIGGLLMHYAYPAGLAGTVLSGWLLHRVGRSMFMRLFCLIALVLAVYTVFCARGNSIALWEAAVVLSLDNILLGGIQVWGFTLMMDASAGQNSGTRFAVLSSFYLLIPLALAPILGRLGDIHGLASLYTVLSCLMVLGFVVAESVLRLSQDGLQRNIVKAHLQPAFEEVGNDK
ncbi:MFS transporter [uncultured Pseudodesulfovibrio sp.]|uniref:MFS transporter n=1 Tax=uncultured Pseudodesulfovibrio sp. TaxID=2035858 RepID=UPI0029C89273|nr:MFS transporter [uncultured Pseudodesulfovibrio sp.]